MRVRVINSFATDERSYACGERVEIDAALAGGFISAGLAVPDPADDVESAVVETSVERAVSRKGRR